MVSNVIIFLHELTFMYAVSHSLFKPASYSFLILDEIRNVAELLQSLCHKNSLSYQSLKIFGHLMFIVINNITSNVLS